jgi:hypothetical protein
MHEVMYPLLNAYLDGELHGTRLQQMETHLTSCETCKNELKELRRVSELLHAVPLPEIRRVDRFVANLTLNLPQQPLGEHRGKQDFILWWLIPMSLVFDWFFVRAVILLRDILSVTGTAGLLGGINAWFSGGAHQPLWMAGLNWISGGQAASGATFNLLNTVNGFATGFVSGFLWQAGIGLVYLGWLVVWWFRRRPQPVNTHAPQARS